jgi:hypothetical protein
MNDFFSSGFFLGFFFVLLAIFLFISILAFIENYKKNRFLVEINSIQEYEDWKNKRGKFGGLK